MKGTDLAPAGTIWVCGACGKTASSRHGFRDTSCMTHAVLCYERTLDDPSTLGDQWKAVEPQPEHG
jgi:hypothetical protein